MPLEIFSSEIPTILVEIFQILVDRPARNFIPTRKFILIYFLFMFLIYCFCLLRFDSSNPFGLMLLNACEPD
ncbi:unnamed protein product [Coffea canephora]|uniref:DH200=94 genomic scaffold, scaffold_3381 n=1 Tax=Coffea canephora TaxID=49390 RepID=A0A068VNL8_COFCA|nr:unnamed protein product [Coffea canephora]